jgi:DNA-binding MarR family transcriptional regulator
MSGFDELIHQPVRLRIMAALVSRSEREPVEFTWLKNLLKLTDGNLGAHIVTLEKAGYAVVEKDFVGRKPRTRIAATKPGRRAFADHVAALEAIVRTGEE